METLGFLPVVGGLGFTIAVFIVALLIIVAVHEYGHYIVGRWCGIHADVFSLGMGKPFFKRTDKRGTVWQLAWIPAGGYVKFAGDANAASVGGTSAVAGRDARHTMLGAPLWARSLTVLAGPVANFILGGFIFAGLFMWVGAASDDLVLERSFDVPAQWESELQSGDRILGVEDIRFGDDNAPSIDDLPKQPRYDYLVVRDGAELTVKGPHPIIPRIDSLTPRSAADDARLRVGDFITAIDGEPIYAFRDIVAAVQAAGEEALTLTVDRDGEVIETILEPRWTDEFNENTGEWDKILRIGIGGTFFFDPATDPLGPVDAVQRGFAQVWEILVRSLQGIGAIMTGEISTCNLNSPVGMAETVSSMAKQGFDRLVGTIAFLSVAVGLLNLFPIPILDGGHLVFHAYEAVTRRKPSDVALNILMAGGLAIILTVMIFALFNDLIFCP